MWRSSTAPLLQTTRRIATPLGGTRCSSAAAFRMPALRPESSPGPHVLHPKGQDAECLRPFANAIAMPELYVRKADKDRPWPGEKIPPPAHAIVPWRQHVGTRQHKRVEQLMGGFVQGRTSSRAGAEKRPRKVSRLDGATTRVEPGQNPKESKSSVLDSVAWAPRRRQREHTVDWSAVDGSYQAKAATSNVVAFALEAELVNTKSFPVCTSSIRMDSKLNGAETSRVDFHEAVQLKSPLEGFEVSFHSPYFDAGKKLHRHHSLGASLATVRRARLTFLRSSTYLLEKAT